MNCQFLIYLILFLNKEKENIKMINIINNRIMWIEKHERNGEREAAI
jgi:hypothetical protein